jgi:hypothetical protein
MYRKKFMYRKKLCINNETKICIGDNIKMKEYSKCLMGLFILFATGFCMNGVFMGSVSAAAPDYPNIHISEYWICYEGYYELTFLNAEGKQISYHSGSVYPRTNKYFRIPQGDVNNRAERFSLKCGGYCVHGSPYTFNFPILLDIDTSPHFTFWGSTANPNVHYNVNGYSGDVKI